METELPGSADNPISRLSGVVAVSFSPVEESEIRSVLWAKSWAKPLSGVEPLLKRSGRDTLPLSSERGEDP